MVARGPGSRSRGTSLLVRRAIVAAGFIAALGVSARRAYSHPLHTTLSELSIAADGSVQIVLRAFVDDLSAAALGRAGPQPAPVATPPDSATARYLGGTLAVIDAAGRHVALSLAGVRRTGDLLWVTLRTPTAPGRGDVRLTNRVLFERYDDQVNVVQTSVAGRRRTLLFTKRDGATAKSI
jgi:hypothetical protein